jgi:hypothetical protein
VVVFERPRVSDCPDIELPTASLQLEPAKPRSTVNNFSESVLEFSERRAGDNYIDVSGSSPLSLKMTRSEQRAKSPSKQDSPHTGMTKFGQDIEDRRFPDCPIIVRKSPHFPEQCLLEFRDFSAH